jgi:uncharacterized Rmd1/YagE family protein
MKMREEESEMYQKREPVVRAVAYNVQTEYEVEQVVVVFDFFRVLL